MRTPQIETWIAGTMTAIEQGVWKRGDAVYFGMDELLARHGQGFEWAPGPLPEGVPEGKRGECFANAGRLADGASYRYCEGYGLTDGGIIPVHHAWVIDEAGRVVDNTWQSFECAEREYFGVVVPFERLNAAILRRERWGFLVDREVFTKAWEEAS